jgi:hypothetical protein
MKKAIKTRKINVKLIAQSQGSDYEEGDKNAQNQF